MTIRDKPRHLAASIMQMFEQSIEKRQIIRVYAVFIQGQNETALRCLNEEIAVLDTLGNALQCDKLADIIMRQQCVNLLRP